MEEEEWDHDEEEVVAGEPEDEEEDPAALRKRLDKEEATIRMLLREGVAEEHPTMLAAVDARDAAAAAWRASRKPHPLARRMGWAQRNLDRAFRAQDKIREELARFDDEVKAQRDKICARFDEIRARVQKHREALELLQEEAGAQAPSARRGGQSSAVCAKLAGGLRNSVAPNVAALAASLAEGTEAHTHVSVLMAQLESMQHELEQHAAAGGMDHETYDIGDDDEQGSDDEWSESHELGGNPWTPGGGGGRGGRETCRGTTVACQGARQVEQERQRRSTGQRATRR